MKKFSVCPFCGNKLEKKYSGLKDRLMTTKKTFSSSECTSCGVGILNPAPIEDAYKYYPKNYLSSEEVDVQNTENENDLETKYRYNQYAFDFNLLKKPTKLKAGNIKSYLDIGCGSGERVSFVAEQGCKKAFGLDKFDFAKSQSKRNITIINSEILKYKPKETFQVVSLFHVLEHLDNPQEVLAYINKKIIQHKGYLIIQVPNYGSFERHIFKNRWFSLDAPRHYWHFNERSLRQLLEKSGYRVEAVYQKNAALHSVTLVPSLFPELDIQRIWVHREWGKTTKTTMMMLWAAATVMTIPLNLITNLFNRSSMLTVIASTE